MKLLLDTNVFLLAAAGVRDRLSRRALRLIEDPANALILSAVSLWEIILKQQAGKLEFSGVAAFLEKQIRLLDIEAVLAVTASHVLQVFELPPHHRDPFDRLLVAQAQVEGLPLLASDAALHNYDVKIVW